jgi:peptidoglycan DL-endopeptidase CwlO
MTSRNRRNRPANMKARLGIAAAVLVGGGAIGVAVATSGHGAADTAASAGYTLNFNHTVSEGTALSSALSSLDSNQGRALTDLASMSPMKTYSQVRHGRTEFAVQRGVVELATKHFLLVKSANGSLHLWWLAHTKTINASNSMTGMMALTGSKPAATQAMTTGNMLPAASTVAGSTTAASTMAAPAASPTTVTVTSGSATVTITITSSSATVSTPTTTPATTAGMSTTTASSGTTAGGPMTTAKQSAFGKSDGIARGDLAFVAGMREHGFLIARLVLFIPPATSTVTPTATPSTTTTSTATASPTASVTPTAPASVMPTAAPSAAGGVIMGSHS